MKSDQEIPSGATPTADGRATTFQAVQGGQEHYSGETLLVSAYAVLWALLLLWVAFIWRKQGETNARLFDLERVLDKAAADKAAARKT
jgi:hypothetical protein